MKKFPPWLKPNRPLVPLALCLLGVLYAADYWFPPQSPEAVETLVGKKDWFEAEILEAPMRI